VTPTELTESLIGKNYDDPPYFVACFMEVKYNDEQAAKAAAVQQEAADKLEQSNRWTECRTLAESEYNNEEKEWGEPVPGKPGVRSGPANQLQDMKNRLQRKNEECDRNFPKGIRY
jgi:hypothetical protein